MKLSFKIAIRFLMTSKGQTLLISLGIGIGIAVLIFIGSLITGLQDSLIETTIGRSAHVSILSEEKGDFVKNPQDIINRVIDNSDQIDEIIYTLDQPAFIKFNDKSDQILLRGLESDNKNKIYKFEESIVDGVLSIDDNEVSIGTELAKDFGINIGDMVILQSVNGTEIEYKVTSIFDFKVSSINKSWILTEIENVRELGGLDKKIATNIEIQLIDPFNADIISDEIVKIIKDDNISVVNWKVQNESLLSGLKGQSISTIMIQVFVLISVVLGISSVLAISVMQKQRQLGILKAMGLTDSDSSLVFLFEGFILGIFGGIIGIVIGVSLLFAFSTFAFSTFALNSDGTPVVPVTLDPFTIGLSGLIAVISSSLAALIPALKSKKLSPMEVIKNG
jgi:lipoprotein-releasing system permease protein